MQTATNTPKDILVSAKENLPKSDVLYLDKTDRRSEIVSGQIIGFLKDDRILNMPEVERELEHCKVYSMLATPEHRDILTIWLDEFLSGNIHKLPNQLDDQVFMDIDDYGIYMDMYSEQYGITIKMRYVKPQEFLMGSPEDAPVSSDQKPQHRVVIHHPYWVHESTVTVKDYAAVMGNLPNGVDDKDPMMTITKVNWNSAKEWADKVSASFKMYAVDLMLEAEWECACRTGSDMITAENFDEYAWHFSNSGHKVHPVKQLKPNSYGIYDMLGNVWEWCNDDFESYADLLKKPNPDCGGLISRFPID